MTKIYLLCHMITKNYLLWKSLVSHTEGRCNQLHAYLTTCTPKNLETYLYTKKVLQLEADSPELRLAHSQLGAQIAFFVCPSQYETQDISQ